MAIKLSGLEDYGNDGKQRWMVRFDDDEEDRLAVVEAFVAVGCSRKELVSLFKTARERPGNTVFYLEGDLASPTFRVTYSIGRDTECFMMYSSRIKVSPSYESLKKRLTTYGRWLDGVT